MSDLRRVLLVENDPNDVELATKALATHHLASEVMVIQDSTEVLDYLLRQGRYAQRMPGHPAVILLDLKMPKMDGLELLQEIRAHQALKLIPVVMLTSSAGERDVLKSYQLGANAYIVKPVDFKDFVEALALTGAFWATLNTPPPARIHAGEVG